MCTGGSKKTFLAEGIGSEKTSNWESVTHHKS